MYFIYLEKKSVCKWTHAVKIYIVQGSTVHVFASLSAIILSAGNLFCVLKSIFDTQCLTMHNKVTAPC